MSLINVVLWVGGVVLIVIGYQRFRGPWSRYQALKEEDANAERYAAWRGGVRGLVRHDRGLGCDADPAAPGPDRRRRSRSPDSSSSSSAS